MREVGYSEAKGVCERTKYQAVVDGTRSLCTYSWREYLEVLGRHNQVGDASIHSHWRSRWSIKRRPDVDVQIEFKRSPSVLVITVGSRDEAIVGILHDRLHQCFDATIPFQFSSANKPNRQPNKTVFLAHRFDDCGRAAAAAVHKFLNVCGFSVVEGEGYEARSIPTKVEERIAGQDCCLAIITPGDATWVVSEASYAHGCKKLVLFLVQEGVDIRKGIFGSDYEHMPFPSGNVEKAFTDLLSALT